MRRWLKFNAVGMMGAAVQLAMLSLLDRSGLSYLVATPLAVEAAIVHNYVWHVRWTWRDQMVNGPAMVSAFCRFQLANGVVSLISNLLLMRVFVGIVGMPAVAANVVAIGITSVVNYLLGDRWVFAERREE